MTELKPCPFCGGKNIIHFNNGFCSQVYCANCNCGTALYKRDTDRDRAVEAWNRRAETVKSQPSADVAEVRHGKWISHGIAAVCSVCQTEIVIEQYEEDLNYCPDCGAKMDGKVGDSNA